METPFFLSNYVSLERKNSFQHCVFGFPLLKTFLDQTSHMFIKGNGISPIHFLFPDTNINKSMKVYNALAFQISSRTDFEAVQNVKI